MLENCEVQKQQQTVYRLAALFSYKLIGSILVKRGATLGNLQEIKNLLNRLSVPLTVDEKI